MMKSSVMDDVTNGWKTDLVKVRSERGVTYMLNAEITPQHFDRLTLEANELSRKIMEKEEVIVLDAFSDEAILRLRDLVHAQIVMRELK